MIKVYKQLKAGKYTVLLLDSAIPATKFTKLVIDGAEYAPEMVYDLKDSIGITGVGDFEGKEVKFIA